MPVDNNKLSEDAEDILKKVQIIKDLLDEIIETYDEDKDDKLLQSAFLSLQECERDLINILDHESLTEDEFSKLLDSIKAVYDVQAQFIEGLDYAEKELTIMNTICNEDIPCDPELAEPMTSPKKSVTFGYQETLFFRRLESPRSVSASPVCVSEIPFKDFSLVTLKVI